MKERSSKWNRELINDIFTSTDMSRSEVIESNCSKNDDHGFFLMNNEEKIFKSEKSIKNFTLSDQKGLKMKKITYPLTSRFKTKNEDFTVLPEKANVNHLPNKYQK